MPHPRPNLHTYAKSLGVSHAVIRRYASAHNWKDRARAWDEQTKVITAAQVEPFEDVRKAHLQALRTARLLAALTLKRYLERAEDGRDEVSVKDAMLLLREAVTLERLILGEATDRVEVQQRQEIDVTQLAPEEAEQLIRLLERAGYVGDDGPPLLEGS